MLVAPLRSNNTRGNIASGASMPAPVKGWNDKSPLAAMSPEQALQLDNWFPQPAYVELRKGWAQHSDTSETTPVKTLMAYQAPNSANDKLFGVSNDTIYNVTGSSASATSVTTLTSAELQHVNFTTSGGSYLYAVNGADLPVAFDGTSWTNPAITGVDESTFIHLNVFKNRLFFIPKNSTKFWYLAVDSIAGAATSFELGGLMSLGGYVMAMGTITIDGGSGPDDHAVFVTSEGQVIVYQGSDPSDSNAWALVGVYSISPPIGRRCLTKIAGDLGILTTSGLLPLSKAMVVDRAAVANVALTDDINNTFTRSAQEYGSNFGWQVIVHPKSNMCIVNVPLVAGGASHQYVMNTLHGAWARFTNQAAACFEVFQDRLFFGGQDGKVYEADSASQDGGEPITADMLTSYQYYQSKGTLKQWKMVQTLLTSDGRVAPGLIMVSDFKDGAVSYLPAQGTISGSNWDEVDWDEFDWGGADEVTNKWQAVRAVGLCAAIRIKVVAETANASPISLKVNGFNVIYERGGFL